MVWREFDYLDRSVKFCFLIVVIRILDDFYVLGIMVLYILNVGLIYFFFGILNDDDVLLDGMVVLECVLVCEVEEEIGLIWVDYELVDGWI